MSPWIQESNITLLEVHGVFHLLNYVLLTFPVENTPMSTLPACLPLIPESELNVDSSSKVTDPQGIAPMDYSGLEIFSDKFLWLLLP